MDKIQITCLKNLSNSIRILSADAIERASSGHPGLPLGFADVFSSLVANFLRFNPSAPKWFARDRLVLSAGHGSMILYSYYHFTKIMGYEMEQIKNFRQIKSNTPGHPEYDGKNPIETTTGPLGQGFANSVGMAIAQKKYENKIGVLAQYKIYCIIGDGCLMEGISLEAASLAAHLNLNNLIVLFDDNKISIDGSTDLATSDDHLAKFKALGWNVLSANGHDFEEIDQALKAAQNSDKPSFISFKTKIGFGSGSKEGTENCHGSPLGKESIETLRKNLNISWAPFEFPAEIYEEWEKISAKNNALYQKWSEEFEKLDPKLQKYAGDIDKNIILDKISVFNHNTEKDEATRASSGKIIEIIQRYSDKVICGSADLSSSNNIINNFSKPITKEDFSGNFIHYGVREAAMAGIMNGLAVSGFLPIGGTFLVFSDYMRAGIRLSSLMNLPVIYIMTHDSIGVGEDGPTHQPIEHLASLRAMPNIKLYRPADMLEVEACFNDILKSNSPAILALTRQKLKQMPFSLSRRNNIEKGAYILSSTSEKPEIAIWASGSEIQIASEVSKLLNLSGIESCVISACCIENYLSQTKDYINELRTIAKVNVVIEAGSRLGWDRITGNDALFFCIDSFGESGKAEDVYNYFGLNISEITNNIISNFKSR
mgnify:CR=1 FL=1